MVTVLGRRNSGNVQKVMWALGELGVDYQREDVGGSFGYPDDYPNPNQVVPTIRDGDVVVWESNACVRYLARTYGAGTMWPSDPATLAEADMWMEWQRGDISALFLVFQIMIRGREATQATLEDAQKTAQHALGQLDAQLVGRQFICGDQLTTADIVIGAMMYRYNTLPIERAPFPEVDAWYQRLVERPTYQKHVMIEYGSNIDEWAERERASAGIQ